MPLCARKWRHCSLNIHYGQISNQISTNPIPRLSKSQDISERNLFLQSAACKRSSLPISLLIWTSVTTTLSTLPSFSFSPPPSPLLLSLSCVSLCISRPLYLSLHLCVSRTPFFLLVSRPSSAVSVSWLRTTCIRPVYTIGLKRQTHLVLLENNGDKEWKKKNWSNNRHAIK